MKANLKTFLLETLRAIYEGKSKIKSECYTITISHIELNNLIKEVEDIKAE